MEDNYNEKRLKKVKAITLRNTMLTLPGYFVGISGTYIAKFFNLSSCTYSQVNYLFLFICIVISIFTLIIYTRKTVTIKFSQVIGLMQLGAWLIICVFWLKMLNEARILGLFVAVVPFTFFFIVGNILSSLIVVVLFETVYLSVAYYGITVSGQPGNFTLEVFHSYCSFFSALFLVLMAHAYQKQKKVIKSSQKKTKATSTELEIKKR